MHQECNKPWMLVGIDSWTTQKLEPEIILLRRECGLRR